MIRQTNQRRTGARRALGFALGCVVGALCASAAVAGEVGKGWRPLAAGSVRHAWFITPVDVPTDLRTGKSVRFGELHHAPVAGELGAVAPMRAHTLVEAPIAVTAFGDRLVLVYAPSDDHEQVYPVRSVRALSPLGPTGGPVVLVDPPDRYAVEPPLVTTGRVRAVADTALGLAALVKKGAGFSLEVLGREGWSSVKPPAWGGATPVSVRAIGAGLAVLGRDPKGGAIRWWLDSISDEWSRSAVDPAALDAGAVAIPSGVVAPTREPDGAMTLRLVHGTRVYDLSHLDGVGANATLARLGNNLAIFWTDKDSPNQLNLAVVSGDTGRTLYSGPARFGPPLTPADLRLVGFLVSAVMLGVLLFLLRPETPAQASPPPGWVLADLSRRALAGAIDVLLAGAVSAVISRVSLPDAIDPVHLLLLDSGDTWPVLLTSGLYLTHGTVAEWLFGRTLGKAVTGCRVASTRGEKVRFWQAGARNLVKTLVPPLVALVLVDPSRRHPGDLLGRTLVVARAGEGDGESDHDAEASKPDEGDSRENE